MTEAKLEALIAAKVDALNLAGVAVKPFFAVAPAGGLANAVTEESDAVLDITPSNRENATWELPQFDFTFALSLRSRFETDADCSAHVARVSALTGLFAAYCGRGASAALRSDFTIESEFTPVMAQLSGGSNEVDEDRGYRIWNQTFMIRGITL